MSIQDLGQLAKPVGRKISIETLGFTTRELLDAFEKMTLIRVAEEVIGDMVEGGEVKCPCHLAIGQEAVAVGVCSELRRSDAIFGAHRSHGHYLALGAPLVALMYEVLGMSEGCSGGFGGSMHLKAPEYGLLGTVPIVAATIPIMVGAGLGLKLAGSTDVAVAFFGDGATEEGVFHESLNLAKCLNIPAFFVVENNLYASHLHISERQPIDRTSRFGEAHQVTSHVVDGNDVLAVRRATRQLMEIARGSRSPVLLEAVTYRWRGHVGHREDLDVGVERPNNLALWKKNDPIARLVDGIIQGGLAKREELEVIEQRIRKVVAEAQRTARSGIGPSITKMESIVYHGKSK